MSTDMLDDAGLGSLIQAARHPNHLRALLRHGPGQVLHRVRRGH